MDRISPNFIYAFILSKSKLGLSNIIFCTFVPELWPLIYSKISFPLNILRTNGHILTKLYITISGFDTKLNVWGSLGLNFDYEGGPIIENGGPIFLYMDFP